MSLQAIEAEWPQLLVDGYSKTSDETDDYNCIAWTGDDTTRKWDPDPTSGRYWPSGIPRSLDVESFIKLYEAECGYIVCDNDSLEEGIEKIAIFRDLFNQVTHAARQLKSGAWTSKLGDLEDIEHNKLSSLQGAFYGQVAQIMKRPRKP
ncbi:MAG: hypothetical protein ABSH38_05005 [Verrucomicrobiota bacterium]|jgi:hypothetical protein